MMVMPSVLCAQLPGYGWRVERLNAGGTAVTGVLYPGPVSGTDWGVLGHDGGSSTKQTVMIRLDPSVFTMTRTGTTAQMQADMTFSATASKISDFTSAVNALLPTNVSQLSNDSGYVTTSAMTSALASYALGTDMADALALKMDIPAGTTSQILLGNGSLAPRPTALSAFTNDAGFITSAALSSYATTASVTTALGGYVTTGALASALSPYALTSSIPTVPTLVSAFTNDAGYLTSTALSGYATTSSVTSTLSGYVTNGSLSSSLASYVTISSLSGYVTTSSLTSTLSGYVASSSLTSALAPYALASSLSGYATTATATTSTNGLMSAADKAKLDTVAEEQRTIVTVSGSAGRATWTYPVAYGSGVVPVIQAIAVKPSGSTSSYNTQIYTDPTNTSVTIEVQVVPNTITGILGLIGIITPAPAGTKIHIIAKAP